MRPLHVILGSASRNFLRDRRGIAAVEFAMIAPALIFLVMGVLEMSFRFRANEMATRYVHEVADLISREETLSTATLNQIYAAAPYMMAPLTTTGNLDIDVSSVAFEGTTKTPDVHWRRYKGAIVPFAPSEAAGMGLQDETVIRVGITYRYDSVLTSLFGGGHVDLVRSAFARPREERIVTFNGIDDDGGTPLGF